MIKIIIGGQARTGGALLARILDGIPQTISLPHEPTFYYKFNKNLYGKNSSIYEVFNFFKLGKDKLFFKRKHNNFYEDLSRNIKIKINFKKIDEELIEKLDRNVTYDEAINLYARIANNNIFNVENINFLVFQRSNFYTTNFNDIENLSNLVFIHSIRHPLDQLYSDITKTKKSSWLNLHVNLEEWFINWAISAIQSKLLESKNYIFLRYEDVIENSNFLFDKLKPFGMKTESYEFKPTLIGNLWFGNSSFDNNENIHFNGLLRSKNKFNKRTISIFHKTIGNILEIFGYKEDKVLKPKKLTKDQLIKLHTYYSSAFNLISRNKIKTRYKNAIKIFLDKEKNTINWNL